MKDLASVLTASVIPIITIMAAGGIVFMIMTGQEPDPILLGVVGAGLSKMGISFGIGKVRKR